MNDLIPILLFTLSTTLTPGPNNFMLLNAGLHFGVRRSLGLYFGICLGFPLMVLMVALGLGAVFTQYLWLKEVLKVLGSLYLLYLAYQIFRSHTKIKAGHGKPLSFFKAILFQWVNPKAWLMAIGAISIFAISTNVLNNALILSAIFFIVCLPCLAAWLFFGALLQKVLKEEKHRQWFNAFMALCLVASVVMIFFE